MIIYWYIIKLLYRKKKNSQKPGIDSGSKRRQRLILTSILLLQSYNISYKVLYKNLNIYYVLK